VSVDIGGVGVGSDHPVVVQSMTNTDTVDVEATVQQVRELAEAGSELVRVTVNSEDAAQAVPEIVEALKEQGIETPIIGGIGSTRGTSAPPVETSTFRPSSRWPSTTGSPSASA